MLCGLILVLFTTVVLTEAVQWHSPLRDGHSFNQETIFETEVGFRDTLKAKGQLAPSVLFTKDLNWLSDVICDQGDLGMVRFIMSNSSDLDDIPLQIGTLLIIEDRWQCASDPKCLQRNVTAIDRKGHAIDVYSHEAHFKHFFEHADISFQREIVSPSPKLSTFVGASLPPHGHASEPTKRDVLAVGASISSPASGSCYSNGDQVYVEFTIDPNTYPSVFVAIYRDQSLSADPQMGSTPWFPPTGSLQSISFPVTSSWASSPWYYACICSSTPCATCDDYSSYFKVNTNPQLIITSPVGGHIFSTTDNQGLSVSWEVPNPLNSQLQVTLYIENAAQPDSVICNFQNVDPATYTSALCTPTTPFLASSRYYWYIQWTNCRRAIWDITSSGPLFCDNAQQSQFFTVRDSRAAVGPTFNFQPGTYNQMTFQPGWTWPPADTSTYNVRLKAVSYGYDAEVKAQTGQGSSSMTLPTLTLGQSYYLIITWGCSSLYGIAEFACSTRSSPRFSIANAQPFAAPLLPADLTFPFSLTADWTWPNGVPTTPVYLDLRATRPVPGFYESVSLASSAALPGSTTTYSFQISSGDPAPLYFQLSYNCRIGRYFCSQFRSALFDIPSAGVYTMGPRTERILSLSSKLGGANVGLSVDCTATTTVEYTAQNFRLSITNTEVEQLSWNISGTTTVDADFTVTADADYSNTASLPLSPVVQPAGFMIKIAGIQFSLGLTANVALRADIDIQAQATFGVGFYVETQWSSSYDYALGTGLLGTAVMSQREITPRGVQVQVAAELKLGVFPSLTLGVLGFFESEVGIYGYIDFKAATQYPAFPALPNGYLQDSVVKGGDCAVDHYLQLEVLGPNIDLEATASLLLGTIQPDPYVKPLIDPLSLYSACFFTASGPPILVPSPNGLIPSPAGLTPAPAVPVPAPETQPQPAGLEDSLDDPDVRNAIIIFLTSEMVPVAASATLGEPSRNTTTITWVISLVFDHELSVDEIDSVSTQVETVIASQLQIHEYQVAADLEFTSSSKRAIMQAWNYDAIVTITGGATQMIGSILMSFIVLFGLFM